MLASQQYVGYARPILFWPLYSSLSKSCGFGFQNPIQISTNGDGYLRCFLRWEPTSKQKNSLLTLSMPSAPTSLSSPSISWNMRPWRPTPNYTGSTSSYPYPTGYQVILGLLLQISQPYWTPSQSVPYCGIYETREVSSPLMLCDIVLHSWTHPRTWDNLGLYLIISRWIHLSMTYPSTTNLCPCIPLNQTLLANNY